MISLIGLPLLALCLIPRPAKPLYTLRIFLPMDEIRAGDEFSKHFAKQVFYKTLLHKKVVAVDMPARDTTDQDFIFHAKRQFIVSEIERLTFTGDSGFVLKVSLSDSSTFGDFVWLVNQTLKYKIRRWIFADNSFFFVNLSPDKRQNVKEQVQQIFL